MQVKESLPGHNYGKIFKLVSAWGHRRKLVIKPQYREYWESEGQNSISETPGFRKVMNSDWWLSVWSFLHEVDETDETLDKTDAIYKSRPVLNSLFEKFCYCYLSKQHLS